MPIEYTGPNSELVSDVINVANLGFSPAKQPDVKLAGVEFTADLGLALDSCFDQEYEPLIGVSPRGRAMLNATSDDFVDGITWQDIRSNMVAAEIWTMEWYEWIREHKNAIDPLQGIDDAWESITNQLCGSSFGIERDYAASIGEDIAGILTYAAQGRAFRGTDAVFHNLLFSFCRLGFWPCGFVGVWPENGHYLLWHGK
ncbi:MAG: hypothetical protein AAF802_04395 [Planctomycetota bacterium]